MAAPAACMCTHGRAGAHVARCMRGAGAAETSWVCPAVYEAVCELCVFRKSNCEFNYIEKAFSKVYRFNSGTASYR